MFLFGVFFVAVLVSGCLNEPSGVTSTTATPTTVISQVSSPSPLPSLVPSPTIVVELPSPTSSVVNYSKEEALQVYLTAVNAQDYEKAYSLVSRDFKSEDSDAATLDSFKARLEKDYPYGLSFSDVVVPPDSYREVLATITKGGSSTAKKLSFIISFESGFWKLRIPFPTAGKYYNANVSLQLTSPEVSRLLELALNDFFSRIDPKVKNDPFELSEYDKINHVYYSSKTVKLRRNDGLSREARVELNFGPSFIVGGLSNSADLLEDRPLYFEYVNGIKVEGGRAGFFCYTRSSNLFLKVKLDRNFAEIYSYEDNVFAPVIKELNKICPP